MERNIAVVGLGYVGLPVAVAFGQKQRVIAFDINQQRIEQLKNNNDITNEVCAQDLETADLLLTSDVSVLATADFFIVAVPTPIDEANRPDLSALLSASKLVGSQLKSGDIVVYESTVYPGATEEDCVPVLEAASALCCGKDFFVGYSPERINPGDKEHTFTKITKIVAGQTPEVLKVVSAVYGSVVTAGVYEAASIKVAEAAKVIENTQRDVNIALVNELQKIFDKLAIDTMAVLEAAGTKWNFLPFRPGLVGGHCIGVDPFYLTHKAIQVGYHPEVILAGRRINDSMGKYIAEQAVKKIIKSGEKVSGAKIGILGFTFKENCPDVRNTRVIDIVRELQEYSVDVLVHDPQADAVVVKQHYDLALVDVDQFKHLSALIIAVGHDEYKLMPEAVFHKMLDEKGVIIDVKSILPGKRKTIVN